MDFFTVDKLILITVFFVPGFIYLKTYNLFIAEVRTDFSKSLYEAIGISFINAIFFAYPIYIINRNEFIDNHAFWYFFIIVFIVVVAPVMWAILFYIISKRKLFLRYMVSPTKSAWDIFFSKRESYWVVITLKNGRQISGKYGLNSVSSTYPLPKEIYIEDVWELYDKGGFKRSIPNNEGILITENEISTIEFYI